MKQIKKEHDYLQQCFDVRQAIWRRKKSFLDFLKGFLFKKKLKVVSH